MSGYVPARGMSVPVQISDVNSPLPPLRGTGFLSGTITDDGAPVVATIRALWRPPGAETLQGVICGQTTSATDGTWRIDDINPELTYTAVASMASRNDAIAVNITPRNPPRLAATTATATVGQPLDYALPIIGGVGTVTATLTSGTPPSGVTYGDGKLTGTHPTGATGDYTLTFDLIDDNETVTATLTLTLVLLPLALSPESLPAMVKSETYSATIAASGGEGPYTYSVSAGSLPTGLSLNSSTGALTGTPTTGGAYSFTITATDVRSAAASRTFAGSVLVGKHAYWRLNITANNGNANTSIAELRMRDSSGINVATGGTAFANTEYSSGFVAGYAFDGNAGTRWAANGTHPLPHQIGYIMAAAEDVVAVEIVSSAVIDADGPRDFSVQSSDDGVSWTDEWSVTGATGWGANEQRTFPRP